MTIEELEALGKQAQQDPEYVLSELERNGGSQTVFRIVGNLGGIEDKSVTVTEVKPLTNFLNKAGEYSGIAAWIAVALGIGLLLKKKS